MDHKNIAISNNFRKTTVRAILSIILFVLTYLVLIVLAVILTILFGFAGVWIVEKSMMFYTVIVLVAMVSMGIFILFFLIKFIFKKHTVDRSHLIEVLKKDESELFAFIDGIVKEVKTGFPKKIYFSANVNACVFYDSSFWSMFFPIRKNLQIGIGLVNSVTALELKAILAHEFGHFSQRSMKVGSYVYNVNQIIYNLLYDNEAYEEMTERWANAHAIIGFFVVLGNNIIKDMQKVLKNVYRIVNLNYLGMSREMEFHADKVAACVTGSVPLMNSLLRLDLSDYSYNTVIGFYNGKIAENFTTENIYPQHHFVMNHTAKQNKISIENDLPQVRTEHVTRYNKSKLVIKDQWSSHPSLEERIRELVNLNVVKNTDPGQPASSLFANFPATQKRLTEKLFSTVTYQEEPANYSTDMFIDEYLKENNWMVFNDVFNNYYDNRNPHIDDAENVAEEEPGKEKPLEILFGHEAVDRIYTAQSLEGDIFVLNGISKGEFKIKSFDYDGAKYYSKDCERLIPVLEKELTLIKEKILENDIGIFNYFRNRARKRGEGDDFMVRYLKFLKYEKEYEDRYGIFTKMAEDTAFVKVTTPYTDIEKNFEVLKEQESLLKKTLEEILSDDFYRSELYAKTEEPCRKYLSQEWEYFDRPVYNEDALKVLTDCLDSYHQLLVRAYVKAKRELLDYFVDLENNRIN